MVRLVSYTKMWDAEIKRFLFYSRKKMPIVIEFDLFDDRTKGTRGSPKRKYDDEKKTLDTDVKDEGKMEGKTPTPTPAPYPVTPVTLQSFQCIEVQPIVPISFNPFVTIVPTLELLNVEKPSFSASFLAAVNAHPLDCTVTCTKHVYSVQWDEENRDFTKDAISVTTLRDKYFKPFVQNDVVARMSKHPDGTHTGKYEGMTSAQVLECWHKACKLGKRVHLIIECFLNGMDIQPYMKYKVITQFAHWYRSYIIPNKLKPFRTEMKIRSSAMFKITGAIDSLWIKENHPLPEECNGVLELEMIDWKVKEILDDFVWDNERGFGPCVVVPASKVNQDSLQQLIYKKMLETFYFNFPYNGHVYKRVHVVKLSLLQLHDRLSCARLIPIELTYQPVVEKLFDERCEFLRCKED